jgi:hypothetical protein
VTPSVWVLLAALSRLEGQSAALGPDGLDIADVAGEGRPLVGTVERRGDELWLVPPGVRVVGPLAHPRLLGPGYRVWVIGTSAPDGLRAVRLGVLLPSGG